MIDIGNLNYDMFMEISGHNCWYYIRPGYIIRSNRFVMEV